VTRIKAVKAFLLLLTADIKAGDRVVVTATETKGKTDKP
jgi:hypothetical protein